MRASMTVLAAGAFALPAQCWVAVRRSRPTPAPPLDDPRRLAAVQAVGNIDDVTRSALDHLARRIATELEAPSAIVSLLDDAEQHFSGQFGLGGGPSALACGGLPLEYSFCRFVVTSGNPLIIGNALTHKLVRNHRSVTEWGVRSYAGVPLYGPGEHIVGTVSAYDTFTHEWGDAEVDQLQEFARIAESLLGTRP